MTAAVETIAQYRERFRTPSNSKLVDGWFDIDLCRWAAVAPTWRDLVHKRPADAWEIAGCLWEESEPEEVVPEEVVPEEVAELGLMIALGKSAIMPLRAARPRRRLRMVRIFLDAAVARTEGHLRRRCQELNMSYDGAAAVGNAAPEAGHTDLAESAWALWRAQTDLPIAWKGMLYRIACECSQSVELSAGLVEAARERDAQERALLSLEERVHTWLGWDS